MSGGAAAWCIVASQPQGSAATEHRVSHRGGTTRMALPYMLAGDEVELIETLDRYPDLPVGTRGYVTKTAFNGIVTVHIRGWSIVANTGAFRVVDEDEADD